MVGAEDQQIRGAVAELVSELKQRILDALPKLPNTFDDGYKLLKFHTVPWALRSLRTTQFDFSTLRTWNTV